MVEIERQRKESVKSQKDGGVWRSGTRGKQIKGYGQAVLDQHKKEGIKIKSKNNKSNITGDLEKENQIIKDVTKTLNQGNAPKNKVEQNNVDSEECKDVVEFLESVKLIKYKDTFIENGFEDIDTILELNDDYLASLGIPLGHKLKIMKRIRELRNDNDSTQESRPATVPVTQSNYMEGASYSIEDIGNNEEEKGQIKYSNMHYSQVNFSNNKIGTNNYIDDNDLPDMCGFEVASHPPTQSSSRADAQTETLKKKAQCSEVGTDSMTNSRKIGLRSSCWQCYKLEIVNLMVSDDQIPDKLFCTLTCLQKYMQNNPMLVGSNSISKCGNENCSNTFIKTKKGSIVGNKWYCSDLCIPQSLPEGEGEYEDAEGDYENYDNIPEENYQEIDQNYYQESSPEQIDQPPPEIEDNNDDF